MNPTSTFKKFDGSEISFVEYYRTNYEKSIEDLQQPLLISRPKKRVSNMQSDQTIRPNHVLMRWPRYLFCSLENVPNQFAVYQLRLFGLIHLYSQVFFVPSSSFNYRLIFFFYFWQNNAGNFQAQSKYAVIKLIHTQNKWTEVFLCDKSDVFLSF